MPPRKRPRSFSPSSSPGESHDMERDEKVQLPVEDSEVDQECDTITILYATDNHLGYLEKDPIRGEDSFQTFEEILQLAQQHNVDMILQGGDLFHENHPSRKTLHRTLELFRAYCLGDRPCAIEILSDQSENFPNRFATANYQDPNYNIGLPVFAIHGNHDDPSGDGHLSALDLLSTSGVLNYFGQHSQIEHLTVSPILCRKGQTYLALYGLGYIRDERLHRMFLQRQVDFLQPLSMTGEWFRLALIHQNHTKHSATSYLPETFLSHLDLVLWGHEHDCHPTPSFNEMQKFHVLLPGSSVATSMTEGEARPKHVMLLRIKGTSFTSTALPLTTVRPIYVENVSLKSVPGLRAGDVPQAERYLFQHIESMLTRNTSAKLPLLRLNVDVTGFHTSSPMIHPSVFLHTFHGRVANPKDMVAFHQHRPKRGLLQTTTLTIHTPNGDTTSIDNPLSIEQLVVEAFKEEALNILPESQFMEAVRLYVEKSDSDAVKRFLSETLNSTCTYLNSIPILSEDEFLQAIAKQKKLANKVLNPSSLLPSFSIHTEEKTMGLETRALSHDASEYSDDLFMDDHLEDAKKPTQATGSILQSFGSQVYSNRTHSDFDFDEYGSQENLETNRPRTSTRSNARNKK